MPPLRFRTAGFPQYGSKTAEQISFCGPPFPVAGFDAPFSARSATRSLNPVGHRHVGTILTSARTPLPHGSFAPPGLCCPLASSLLRPDPPVSRSPHASSVRLARAALRARDLPRFGSPTILLVPPPTRRGIHQQLLSVPSLVHIGLRPFSGGSACPISRNSIHAGEPFDAYRVFVSCGPRFC